MLILGSRILTLLRTDVDFEVTDCACGCTDFKQDTTDENNEVTDGTF